MKVVLDKSEKREREWEGRFLRLAVPYGIAMTR